MSMNAAFGLVGPNQQNTYISDNHKHPSILDNPKYWNLNIFNKLPLPLPQFPRQGREYCESLKNFQKVDRFFPGTSAFHSQTILDKIPWDTFFYLVFLLNLLSKLFLYSSFKIYSVGYCTPSECFMIGNFKSMIFIYFSPLFPLHTATHPLPRPRPSPAPSPFNVGI